MTSFDGFCFLDKRESQTGQNNRNDQRLGFLSVKTMNGVR
jgi:hypothetical protein